MSFLSKMQTLTKINGGYDHWEEFELAPGLIMRVSFEGDNGLPEVVDKFLRQKASFGELKRTLKARGSLRYPSMNSASLLAENPKEGGEQT
jgi:hypothetical protein